MTGERMLPLAANHVLDLFFLSGDANRDARVNLQDFNILAANFGQTNRTFTQGDLNYDGRTNLLDFNLLASRFGTVLSPLAPRSAFDGQNSSGDEAEPLEPLL